MTTYTVGSNRTGDYAILIGYFVCRGWKRTNGDEVLLSRTHARSRSSHFIVSVNACNEKNDKWPQALSNYLKNDVKIAVDDETSVGSDKMRSG